MAQPLTDPLFWVHRLTQRLLARQQKYQTNEDYDTGNHPVPNGDPRFVKALAEIQRKAKTNYVGLANKAVTDRMKVRGFRFADPKQLDDDARRIWNANSMDIKAKVAIRDAARLSDVYAMVSPPREEGGSPLITIEDPRVCITEPDPLDPSRSVAGLKFYEDSIEGTVVAILVLPDRVYIYNGPTLSDYLARETRLSPETVVSGGSAWRLRESHPNPIGEVFLYRGAWQPEYGIVGMAECENGGFDIQDRINDTVLARMVITRSQAFRQRWMVGGTPPNGKKGQANRPPFDGAADTVWALADPKARFGDFEQADIRQILEAIRDDVGDFAAITQTPVTYLTNKMVNVSSDTMMAAQVSLVSKTQDRMAAMGGFFENVMKACFRYLGDSRADEVMAEVVWHDPETRSMAEVSDMISKLSAAGLPLEITMEWAGFSDEQIKFAIQKQEEERQRQEEAVQRQHEMAKEMAAEQSKLTKSSPPPGEREKAK